MKEGHSIAHKLGYEYSVVLGHSKYYPKAGYIPASECGIKAPFEVDDESFMALNLNGSQNKLNGVIEYDKAFGIWCKKLEVGKVKHRSCFYCLWNTRLAL